MSVDLSTYDIVLAIDKSGSMATADGPNGRTRWESAKESAIALATKAAQFDADGITIVPFASTHKLYDNVTPEKVVQVFEENDPMGSTNTAGVLQLLFNRYFDAKAAGNAKPVIIQVITDGAPDDEAAVKRVIIEATQKMDADEEIGVQFLQFGNDAGATKFLQDLDDNLVGQGAKFDIVDTKSSAEAEGIPLAELLQQAIGD